MFAAHGQYAAQWIFDQTTYTVFHIAIFPTIVALTISTYQLPAQRAVYFPIATLIAVLCFILVILDDPDSPQSRYLFTNSKHLYKLEQDTRDAWKKYAESLQDAENRNELQNQWRKARGTLEKETQRQTRNGMFCLNSLFTFIVASFLLSVFYMQSIANSFEASSKKNSLTQTLIKDVAIVVLTLSWIPLRILADWQENKFSHDPFSGQKGWLSNESVFASFGFVVAAAVLSGFWAYNLGNQEFSDKLKSHPTARILSISSIALPATTLAALVPSFLPALLETIGGRIVWVTAWLLIAIFLYISSLRLSCPACQNQNKEQQKA